MHPPIQRLRFYGHRSFHPPPPPIRRRGGVVGSGYGNRWYSCKSDLIYPIQKVIYRGEIQRDEVSHITGMGEMRPKWVFLCPILPKVQNNSKLARPTCFFAQREGFWIQSSSAVCLYAGGRHQNLILESICSNAYLTISHTNCWDCPWAINKKTTIRVRTTSRSVIPYRVTNGFLPFISSSTSEQCLCVLFIAWNNESSI